MNGRPPPSPSRRAGIDVCPRSRSGSRPAVDAGVGHLCDAMTRSGTRRARDRPQSTSEWDRRDSFELVRPHFTVVLSNLSLYLLMKGIPLWLLMC
jgi:hypothetical protein